MACDSNDDKDAAWAAKKTAEATVPPSMTDAERLRARDVLLAAFRVTVAGVDVTQWAPTLPPELQGRRRRKP